MTDQQAVRPRAPEGMAGLVKGLAVIEAFRTLRGRITVSDAASEAGTSRAAARRCLLTLTELGFLSHDGKYFRPTPRLLRLGDCYLNAAELPQIAAPFISHVRDLLGESCSVAVLDGDSAMVVARAEAQHIVSTSARVGTSLPAYCSATGRALLSGFTDGQLACYLENREFPQRTCRTVSTAESVRQSVMDTRERGYAISDEELDLGMRSLAVPIRDSEGVIVAAMSVSAFTARATLDEMIAQFLPIMIEQAVRIGRSM